MPGRVFLDTNVLIAFFSGEGAVSQQFAETEVLVSSTVLGELYYGARKSVHATVNLARIEQFAASVQVLSCDAVTALVAGRLGPTPAGTAWSTPPAN
jgi:tRNA(fMet)-specific endonuclease VapC